MRRKSAILLILFVFTVSVYSNPKSGIIWQIGSEDRSASEFALAPDLYEMFLENDFGWEDRYYLVGKWSR